MAANKKNSRKQGLEVIFFDEVGWSFQEKVAKTWARRGETPVLKRVSNRRKAFQSAVGLSLSGKIYKRNFQQNINADCVVLALKQMLRSVGKGFILVWDRFKPHRSKKVTAFLSEHTEVIVEWLPPYAPELNPEEYCHGNVKDQMRNLLATSAEEVERQVENGFNRLRRRPDLLLGFFQHARLRVKQFF